MRTLLGSARNRHRFVATCFLCTLLATLSPPITASAGDQENSTGKLADSEGLPPSSSPQTPVDPPQSAPRWTFSAEAIVLGRTGGANQSLVGLLPGSMQFAATRAPPPQAAEAFNSNQFWQGFSAGPKSERDLSRRVRLRRGVLVFQHLHPERHKDDRPHQSHVRRTGWSCRPPARSGRPRISHTKAWPGKTPPTFIAPRPTDGWIFPLA